MMNRKITINCQESSFNFVDLYLREYFRHEILTVMTPDHD